MKNKINFTIILTVFLIVTLGCGGSSQRIQTNSNTENLTQTSLNNSTLSQDEKQYIEKTGGYLKSLFDADSELTQTALQVGRHEITLGDMKGAIKKVQTIENAGYFGDYGSPTPPKGFEEIDNQVQKIHKMHVAFLNEDLEYWKDNNVEHINSAAATEKKALALIDDTIKKLNKAMDGKTK